MSAMVDTQVLVYACHHGSQDGASKRQQRMRAQNSSQGETCAALLESLDAIYISTVTLVEFCRTTHDSEREWIDALGEKLIPLPLDRSVADKAAKLLREMATGSSGICPRCMNLPSEKPCSKCERHLTKYHRVADAMIAATAEVRKEIDILYCYDSGILTFGKKLKRCTVKEPPSIVQPQQTSLVDGSGRPIA